MRRTIALLVLLAACGGDPPGPGDPPAKDKKTTPEASKPQVVRRVTVRQIVVTFKGAQTSQWVTGHSRSREEAATLAKSLLARIESGVSFKALQKEYSDSRSPKTGEPARFIRATNKGVAHNPYEGEVPYKNLHPDWRKAAFALKPGEATLVDYHKTGCPEGYFILQRIE